MCGTNLVPKAVVNDLSQDVLVFSEVVARCRVNALVPRQVLDVGYVGAVVAQISAIGVTQDVGCQRFLEAGLAPEVSEKPANIGTLELAHRIASGDEQS